MAWSVEFNETAKRNLRKLDRQWQSKILDYLEDQVAVLDDARSRGKALTGSKQGLWRYRLGDYRIICSLDSKTCDGTGPSQSYLSIALLGFNEYQLTRQMAVQTQTSCDFESF